jgi:hypothetical protein
MIPALEPVHLSKQLEMVQEPAMRLAFAQSREGEPLQILGKRRVLFFFLRLMYVRDRGGRMSAGLGEKSL